MTTNYAHPETLVSTDWVAQHRNDKNVRLVEVDVDTTAYAQGHIAGAVGWNWTSQLCDGVRRDITPKADFEKLCSTSGIANDTIVILYGDNNNWFAAWAFWQFKLYGHKDVRLMNGGRKKWELEKRELTTEPPKITKSDYPIPPTDETIRAYLREVLDVHDSGKVNLIDVRSTDEFT